MEVNVSNQSNEISDGDNEFIMPFYERTIKFCILLSLLIHSICCTIFM
jgi:hypothetical protein